MGFAHVLGVLILLTLLVIGIYVGWNVWKNSKLPDGAGCLLSLQCTSQNCDRSWYNPASWLNGKCKGNVAPGSGDADNATPCTQDTDCKLGTTGEAACALMANVGGLVCCAGGDVYSTGCSPTSLHNYCANLPSGAPCIMSESCTSRKCVGADLTNCMSLPASANGVCA